MQLAILFEFPTLNGGERSMLAVLQALKSHRDWKITVLAPPLGPLAEEFAAQGIPQIPWSVRDDSGSRRSPDEMETSLLDHLHTLKPDLVHANSLSMGRILGRVADRLNVPTSCHLRDIIGLSAAAVADLNRLTQRVAVSQATRSFHLAQGMEATRTVVIHNGIDLCEFQPRPRTGFMHRELSIPRDSRLVVAIGQIGLRKGWNVLFDAAMPVCGQLPDVHFLLVGARHSEKAESQRYEADLRERVLTAGLSHRFHWLGERRDVPRILNEADVLVHPAREEPLGRVLIEAAASGVPVVATDVGGTREIIDSEISGRLVPRDNAAAFTMAIRAVLTDESLSSRFRLAARQIAEQRFDIVDAAKRHAQFWGETVSRE